MSVRSVTSRLFKLITIDFPLIALAIAFGLSIMLLDNDIAVAITTSTTAIFLSIFQALWNRKIEVEERIGQSISEKKIPIYENVMRIFFKGLFGDEKNDDKNNSRKSKSQVSTQESNSRPDWIVELRKAVPDLVIWGHEDVLKQLGNLRYLPTQEDSNASDLSLAFEKLMMEMRKDLGHEDLFLRDGDLLKLFINDIEMNLEQENKSHNKLSFSSIDNISSVSIETGDLESEVQRSP